MIILPSMQGFFFVTSGYDPDAQAFFNALAGGGDILTTPQMNAVNQLVLDIKATGVWSNFMALYPIVGGTATAHSWNLINPALYQATFAGSPTQSATGVQFNGTSQWADTGIDNASTPQDDYCLEFYSRTDSHLNELDMGTYAGGSGYFLVSYSNVYYYGLHGPQVGTGAQYYPDTRGLNTIQRTNSTNVDSYQNGALLLAGSSTSFTPPAGAVWFGGCSSPTLLSAKEFALAAIRTSMSSTDLATYYTAVQNYQTALGRQV